MKTLAELGIQDKRSYSMLIDLCRVFLRLDMVRHVTIADENCKRFSWKDYASYCIQFH